MTTPVPTRFTEKEIDTLDRLVAAGVGANRSEVIRRALRHLDDAVRRAEIGRAIVASYRTSPQTSEDDAMALANAIALTEGEPW